MEFIAPNRNGMRIEVIDDPMVEVLRSKSGPERLHIAHEMWAVARERLKAYLRFCHPEWNEAQIDREVAKRLSHGAVQFSANVHYSR